MQFVIISTNVKRFFYNFKMNDERTGASSVFVVCVSLGECMA